MKPTSLLKALIVAGTMYAFGFDFVMEVISLLTILLIKVLTLLSVCTSVFFIGIIIVWILADIYGPDLIRRLRINPDEIIVHDFPVGQHYANGGAVRGE